MRRSRPIWLLFALTSAVAGCDPPPPPPVAFTRADTEVTGPDRRSKAATVAVDVYLDATTSMEGYVGPHTEYAEFLRAFEASLISKWGDDDVRRYKFGTRIEAIDREAYLAARDDVTFYRQRGVFERTNIDSVFARTDADRVSIVVTDLFQNAGDTNALVRKVKDRVFARGLTIGVLAIESTFDGTIYDAPGGSYRFASTPGDASTYRPFYVLAIGLSPQVERLIEALGGTQNVRRDRVAVISPYLVADFDLALTKPPGIAAQGINVASADDGGYRFVVRKGYAGGELDGTLRLIPRAGAAAVVPDRVELAAFRRESGPRDSTRTDDMRIADLRMDGDVLSFTLTIDIDAPPGRYAYLLLFQAGDVDGLIPPAWIHELSTTNPSAEVSPNKTLNLERLLRDLVQASATVQRPIIGRGIISLHKL